jgi:hypothetical protein
MPQLKQTQQIQTKPSAGSQVFWRLVHPTDRYHWNYGYVKYVPHNPDMVQMGRYNRDSGGPVVSISDIEWRKY